MILRLLSTILFVADAALAILLIVEQLFVVVSLLVDRVAALDSVWHSKQNEKEFKGLEGLEGFKGPKGLKELEEFKGLKELRN